MDKKTKILSIVLSVAMLMIMVPVLLELLLVKWAGLNYIFAAGAVATFVVRVMDKYAGANLRVKRLYRIAAVSSLCYCLSAYFKFSAVMHFFPYATGYDWLGFLMAGAALQVYTSMMISHVEKKELRNKMKK